MEELEDRINYPSLPSNYVTLVQLQERWVKEQQRKHREKEEEEERNRREKEEEGRKREDQDNPKRQNQNGERIETNTLSRSRRHQRNRWNQSQKRCGTIGMSERKPEESQSGEIVVDDGERKVDDLKKKKWGENKSKKRGKPRAEEDPTGGTEQLLPEYEEGSEKNHAVLIEGEVEKKEVTSEFRRNGKNLVVNGMVLEKKVTVDGSVEIRRKFEDLSLDGGKGSNVRYGRNMHGGQLKYYTGFGRFNGRRLQKPRGSNLAWVRKGDTSDISVPGAWSSGVLTTKVEEGQKKPIRMRPKESSCRD